MTAVINTDKISKVFRSKSIDLVNRRLLVSRLGGSDQEVDFTVPANCQGLGRVRHFRRNACDNWPANPLPIDPACKALNIASLDEVQAQVFQNAVCNWRCWYCYVPFALLSGDPAKSQWVSPSRLADLYVTNNDRPPILDLTGGQPDLVPEWVLWMMEELEIRGIQDKVYLWSDDNLSNDYFWRYLTPSEIDRIVAYRNYGKVCCFKGIDPQSFAFNTGADPNLFTKQFELFRRYLAIGLDVYGYVTFTTSTPPSRGQMAAFVDHLQKISPSLPLRVVPLKVHAYDPVINRMSSVHKASLSFQYDAVKYWESELRARFTEAMREQSICDISL